MLLWLPALHAGDFNPRSLAGATAPVGAISICSGISILAPSRERLERGAIGSCGSKISILAPSRERHVNGNKLTGVMKFQSSLPRGSDRITPYCYVKSGYFNPRSLAGATRQLQKSEQMENISILAPSRERLFENIFNPTPEHFNPRSLAGATYCPLAVILPHCNFNPRSLAGATQPQQLR